MGGSVVPFMPPGCRAAAGGESVTALIRTRDRATIVETVPAAAGAPNPPLSTDLPCAFHRFGFVTRGRHSAVQGGIDEACRHRGGCPARSHGRVRDPRRTTGPDPR